MSKNYRRFWLRGLLTVIYLSLTACGGSSTQVITPTTPAIKIDNILVAAAKDDPGIKPVALRSGNVYNFVVEFTSDEEVDAGARFSLALIPDISSSLKEGEEVAFELDKHTIHLDLETFKNKIPVGTSTLYIENVLIPDTVDSSISHLLVAYLHEGDILTDDHQVDFSGDADVTKSGIVKQFSISVLPKIQNDIVVDNVQLLNKVTFVEKNKDEAIVNGYMSLPFVDSEVAFFSNNNADVETTLRAFWTTPLGEDVPLYFYDETSDVKLLDREKITIPPSKRVDGDPVSSATPFIYPAELHLDEAGWTKLLQYAGDPALGEEVYLAEIKYQIETSAVNEQSKNDTFEVKQYTFEIESLTLENNSAKIAEKSADNLLGYNAKESNSFKYDKKWSKDWGNDSKVALEFVALVTSGVNVTPVPTIDAKAGSEINLHLFDHKSKLLDYELEFAEGLNLVIDGEEGKQYKYKKGLKSTFKLFDIVINSEGKIDEIDANKKANNSEAIADAKTDVSEGTLLSKLEFKKTWKEEKELFSETFTVGPIPLTVKVSVSFDMDLALGVKPDGFGLELFADIESKVDVLAQGGVGFSFASAGIKVDFLVVKATPSADAGLKIIYNGKEEKFVAQLHTDGKIPIEAIKGTFSLFAEEHVSLPCGIGWVFSIKWCSLKHKFSKDIYTTPAVIDRTGSNALILWHYENPIISLAIPTVFKVSDDLNF